ncbi:ABC-2 type transporter-domain-containing protein [Rhodofomes roseus]|uniref:ABC-2 type transporter-domain-containing protein n=1 Tax=Rhodofomes roseus TaxID=34475 RepID=A0ABQ8K2T3_9APHY|nr:ABC-2 type transporter-domain-containing protein [Rhodofomes roseus]KAH9831126.1 ABC-2 type transporter-domain-containing protein [Rhodofomes roseus]
MAEIPALFIQRPIVQRHSRAAMYHPFVESLALTLVDIPITILTLVLFTIILYFLVGLQEDAGKFFIFLLFVFAMTITMKSWFRALAALFASAAPAQAVAGVSVLILTLYTGYTIPQPSMIGALRWITYINGEISALVNLCRTLGGFSVAYFQVPWATKYGALQAFGVEAAIVAGLFLLIVPALQIKGAYLRARFSG